MKLKRDDFLACFAGLILPLAFAPLNYYFIAVLSPLLLLFSWLHCSPKRAALRGFLFGLGFFGVGVSWIFVSIHVYGDTPIWLAGIFTALFVMALSCFPALQGYLLNQFFPKNNLYKIILAFPAIWVLIEWLRSWLFTGFPWLLLGYSQTDSALRGLAPIIGVYGISFVVLLTSSILLLLFTRIVNNKIDWRGRISREDYILIFFLFYIWFGSGALSHIEWTTSTGDKIQVSLIQGDIPQQLKWSPEYLQKSLSIYENLTKTHWRSELIVWPEAAIPLFLHDAKNFLRPLTETAKKHHSNLITGIPIQNSTINEYYNGIILVGQNEGIYHKRHLVPFGEFLPLQNWLRGIINLFNLPMSDFSPGPYKQENLKLGQWKIAPFICYEIAFSELVLSDLPEANLLMTLSNDAWFGHSLAPAQHLQMSRMQSLQTGRYQLVATNNGITALIKSDGKILDQLQPFTRGVLTGEVVPMLGATPWIKIGIWPMMIFLFLTLVYSKIRSK
ncbi:MAG: apolipoprotein N-acyltransferase [Proteobacteria bacterium]|nr:apolipoprotein N-acyltransferase [Pseudomonadota bacterium]